MLLKPVSSLPAINSKFTTTTSNSSLSTKVNWLNNKTQVQRSRRRRRIVVVAAGGGGYSKKSLDTPGAYELVDEETGDKFIIWGDDNDNDNIPSKQVLQWEPPKPPSKGPGASFHFP